MTLQLIIDSKFNSAGVREAEAQFQRLAKFVETEMQTTGGAENFLANQAQAISSPQTIAAINEQIAKLQQLATAYKNAAIQQYSLGNIAIGDKISSYGDSLQRTADNMRSLTGATEQNASETEKQGGILDLINNRFNKFAFGLFVLQGTIGTVTRLLNQMFDALLEGASIADRSNAFNVLLEDVGMNAQFVRQQLLSASNGVITLDAAMRPTIQLMKAGVPEVANMSGKLLEMAIASAKLSGDLGNTEQIYTTLVRGIVRGSPLLIDNADIYLKLGDATERYAEKMGYASVEQLSAQERIIATAQAVEEQGDAIIALAEDVDSSAETIKAVTTDLENAWNSVKASVGEGAADFIEALDALGDTFDPIVIKMAELAGASDEMAQALADALDDGPISTWATMFISFFDTIGAYIRGFGAEVTEVWNAIVSLIVTGSTLIAEGLEMIRSGDIEGGMARINEQFGVFSDRVADALNPTNQLNIEIEAARERAQQAGREMGLYGDELSGLAGSSDAASDAQSRLAKSFDEMSAGIQAAIEARTGLDAQFGEKRADIEEDLADKIKDINEDLADKLVDISSGLRDKLLDLNSKYKDDVANLAQETAEELQSIDEELADKLADATETATKSREDAYTDRNKGIEDAQEKHQKKLLDIERRYEASRLKALIDRDARALFEAEQARAQGRDEANEDLDDQIKDEEEKLKEKIDSINELEEERRQDAIEAANKRRQDALEAQAKELQDLKDNFAKQKAEAQKAANEQRQDAIRSANEKRRDAQEHYRDSLQDLDEWYREQLMLQKERQLQEKLSELEHLNEMGELTQDHLNELKGMWSDYNSFVGGSTGAGGVSSGGGTILNTSNNPNNVSGGSGGRIGSLESSGSGANVGNWSDWVGPGGIRLNIVSNDSTLQDVLRSGTYEYMLEALNE